MNRRLLIIETDAKRWRLETLQVEKLEKDPREDYFLLSGETLCQYLLRRDLGALIITRGPLPFISGNKATIGFISPLTEVPHYSIVGGHAAEHLLNLDLDGICFKGNATPNSQQMSMGFYIVVRGRAPGLNVEFKPSDDLPSGQRSAYYRLLERELGGDKRAGSIFTLGEGARLGYKSANLAIESFYHAGRGGTGNVFARFASALVLRGKPMELSELNLSDESSLTQISNAEITPLLDKYCARLSKNTGGTIIKLFNTGANTSGNNTLPSSNARQLGYSLADLGSTQVLKATRQGQTGCQWCQVKCRHWHWVAADYAPDNRDIFLDDFEPTYAIFAMLGLKPVKNTFQARLDLLADVEKRLILHIEQMGCDIMDIGLGLAALFEGVERKIIPDDDVPDFMTKETCFGNLEVAVKAVSLLRSGDAAKYPALEAVSHGPQALAQLYPPMQDIVFTGGKQTMGNAGHCNALWTFLMPFGRFFSHYAGQFYKIDEKLPPSGSDRKAYQSCFKRVISQLMAQEFFCLLGNSLSQCGFTFVIFSRDGKGKQLSDDNLLIRLFHSYGIHTTHSELGWFSQVFWAQSIDFKCQLGWRPPTAGDFPKRIYEALSLALNQTPDELQTLMDMLIDEWKIQAKEVLNSFGYETSW